MDKNITTKFNFNLQKSYSDCRKAKASNVADPITIGFLRVKEIWKIFQIKYEVSNLGRIRKLFTKKIIKGYFDKNGYVRISLNGKTFLIHRIVGILFLKGFRKELQINHKNTIKHDNRVSNLEWVTLRQNMKHAFKNNLILKGENHGRAKLTVKKVKVIRFLSKKYFQREIAKKYQVSRSTIARILDNTTWKHI